MTIPMVFERWGLLVLGLVFVITGLAIANQPMTIGWFAHSPLTDGVFVQLPPALVAMPTSAAVALAAGIALIAGWLGVRLGNRSRRAAGDQ